MNFILIFQRSFHSIVSISMQKRNLKLYRKYPKNQKTHTIASLPFPSFVWPLTSENTNFVTPPPILYYFPFFLFISLRFLFLYTTVPQQYEQTYNLSNQVDFKFLKFDFLLEWKLWMNKNDEVICTVKGYVNHQRCFLLLKKIWVNIFKTKSPLNTAPDSSRCRLAFGE